MKIKTKKNWKHWIPIYLFGLPGLIYLLINNYIPLVGLQVAFKKFNYAQGVFGSAWQGFKNFKFLFRSKDAWIMIRNTLGYNIFWILLGIVVGVTAAILLSEITNRLAARFYQTAILLPFLMSMVLIAYLVYAYLSPTSGLFAKIIERITGHMPQFYINTGWWPFILTFVHQWRQIGFGMILYYSSIIGIDKSYYEAAALDGASRLKQHLRITLPLLKPTIIMLLILNLGQVFRSDFGLFYHVPMNQGALFSATQTIDTYVYRALLKNNDVSLSSAASFLQSVVGFIFVFAANKVVQKIDKRSSLF